MILTGLEARSIVYDDHNDWEIVKGTEEIVGQRRWVTERTAIYQHKPTGKYYRFDWDSGSTEMQESQPFEYEDEYVPIEVKSVVQTIVGWEPV